MTTAQIVGLGGYFRSGKDTVADYLVEKHGFVKMFMSKPLLDMTLVLNPIVPNFVVNDQGVPLPLSKRNLHVPIRDLYESIDQDYTLLKTNPEVRRFLQALGTDVGRNMIDQNLWTNIAVNDMRRILAEGHRVAITGIRFLNEVDMVHRLNRTMVDAELVWVKRGDDVPASIHASENSVSEEDFDTSLNNEGTLEDLYAAVDKWVSA